MKKLIGILGFLVLLSGGNVAANSFNMSADHITNKVFNDLYNQGKFSNLDQNGLDEVRQNLQEDITKKLELVKTGELSLDPNASNYFLLDTIKDAAKGLYNLAKNVVTTAVTLAGKVVNKITGVLGGVVDAGKMIIGDIVGNDFVKTVIAAAAQAYSKFAPLVGDIVGFIPVIGDVASIIIDVTAPVVGSFVTKDNLDVAVGAAQLGLDALGYTVSAVSSVSDSSGSVAPSASILVSMSQKASFDSMSAKASSSDQKKAATNLGTVCGNIMNYIKGLTDDAYSKLSKKVKNTVMTCNKLIVDVNAALPN